MRWIVGDVQGCARELEDLLRAVDFAPGRDELWAAGDLINRGPHTLETLRLWHDVGGRAVLGNHEVYALAVHAGLWPRKRDTLDDLRRSPDALGWFEQLASLPVLAHLPAPHAEAHDVWLVHAGLHPAWTDLPQTAAQLAAIERSGRWFEHDDISFATRVRGCTRLGSPSRFAGPPDQLREPYRPWDAYYHGPSLIVHGHWAWRGLHRTGNVLGLDSGCVYGKSLTAWCQDEDRLVQVPSRQPA
ncbi:MAG: hypothetical protein B7733_07910 [Myxococcales bacterium FL481]|nr:MAG: hypothetical protein B7733_07910 [Myxococcales bacterium FL481]